MASDEATIRHVLGLLDRQAFRTLDHAVLQFKDHAQRFHESLRSLLLTSGDCIQNGFAHPSSNLGEAFLDASAPATCQPVQARCTASKKPPMHSTMVQEDIENFGSRPYALRSRPRGKLSTATSAPQRTTRSRAKQAVIGTAVACGSLPKTEVIDLEGDFGDAKNKRERKPQQHQWESCQGNLPTEAAVSDHKGAYPNVSHAKPAVTVTTALRKTKVIDLEDDVIENSNTNHRKTLQAQQESSQGDFPTEAAVLNCRRDDPNQSHGPECQLQDMAAATISQGIIMTTATQEEESACEEELSAHISTKVSMHSDKKRFSLRDPESDAIPKEQFRLLSPQLPLCSLPSKKSILATPCQSITKCARHICGEAPILSARGHLSSRAQSISADIAVLPKSQTTCIASEILAEEALGKADDAIQCKVKLERELSTSTKDGPVVCSPRKGDTHGFNLTPSMSKQSPCLKAEDFRDTGIGQSVSHKRKLSVCGFSAHDQHRARKRISPSYNSPVYEPFFFDTKPLNLIPSPLQHMQKSVSCHDDQLRILFERLNAAGNKYSAELKGVSHEFVGSTHRGLTTHVASEGLGEAVSQAHCEAAGSRNSARKSSLERLEFIVGGTGSQASLDVAGSRDNARKSSLEGSKRVLSILPTEKSALPESSKLATKEVPQPCEIIGENMIPIHEGEACNESQPKALSSFALKPEHSNQVCSAVDSPATLQSEQEDTILSHDRVVSVIKSIDRMDPCLHEHVEGEFSCSVESKDSKHDNQPEVHKQDTCGETLGSLVLNTIHSDQSTSAGPTARLQLEGNVEVPQCQRDSLALRAGEPSSCELADETFISTSNLGCYSAEVPTLVDFAAAYSEQGECVAEGKISFDVVPSKNNVEGCEATGRPSLEANETGLSAQTMHSIDPNTCSHNLSIQPNSIVHITSPILLPLKDEALEMACCQEARLEMPCSQDNESEALWRPGIYQKSPLEKESSGRSSPGCVKNEFSLELHNCIPDGETKEGTEHRSQSGDHNSDNESEMDCSESPSSCSHGGNKKDDADEGKVHETKSKEWKFTPKGDEGILKFNQLLAQGTVNSSRRKRARSPAICTEESCKDLKRIKLLSIEKGDQIQDEGLLQAVFSERGSSGRSFSSMYGFPHFSPIRRFQDAFGMTFRDSPGKSYEKGDFGSLQSQMMGSDKLCKSYTRLPTLRKDYVATPHFRSARNEITKLNKQRSECHLITPLEEDGKENQSPEVLIRGKSHGHANIQPDRPDTRMVLGYANHSLGLVGSPHKRYNLAIGTGSFLDLVQQKQLPMPFPNGKRDIRVRALEAAELARKQEEKRDYERRMRRLECNDARGVDSESVKEKLQNCAPTMAGRGITDKVKKVAELKIRMDQEKAKKQEMEQRKKEEERKKREAELADRKRKRDDADKRDREEKRKRVEEMQRLRKEQEERQRIEFEEKEFKRKMLDERERERKAQEEEAKRQRRLEKEKEAERRRKQDQDLKFSRLAEKQAERKRKEATLQARAIEDEDPMPLIRLGDKLSFLSTESFGASASTDWDAHSKSKIRTRSQTSEDKRGFQMPSFAASSYYQNMSGKLTSLAENGPILSTKPVVIGAGSKCEPFKSLSCATPSNVSIGHPTAANLSHPEEEIQSYEISPYRSSSDDEDNEQPKKPVPLWARKENVLQQLWWQQSVDPDIIFSSEKTCSLTEIFGTTGSRRCKNFMQRSTSGDWIGDHATWIEQLEYKKAMGYM